MHVQTRLVGIALLTLALAAHTWFQFPQKTMGRSQSTFVWPLSGSVTPDLPQSSAYGPRLMASESFRYDYHQGLDLPTPIGTAILAVTTGTVSIAGTHPGYGDGVVQLDHGEALYSNYLHVGASLVITGQMVSAGQPIALSGTSESGFAHLHFEIRQGSVFRADTVNPFRYLPYLDTVGHTIAITHVLPAHAVWIQVTAPAHELDVNQVTMTVRSQVTNQIFDERTLDYEARNKRYDGDPALLDNPDLNGVLIQPHAFGSTSDLYVVDLQFHDLNGFGPVQIDACAIDVGENRVCTTAESDFLFALYLPLVTREREP